MPLGRKGQRRKTGESGRQRRSSVNYSSAPDVRLAVGS